MTRSHRVRRESLRKFTDDEHSMCEVASRYGIYCRGFSQWTFEVLKQRYDWIADRHPGLTRLELERLANLWQLAPQQVHGTEFSCDSQNRRRHLPTARGQTFNLLRDERIRLAIRVPRHDLGT